MKKLLIAATLVSGVFGLAKAQAPATPADATQPVLVEKVTAKPGELVIPYEKWQLPNGMIVMISEDHSDPIVHVDVTYHVGSARETPGKSGFAHFFEHMMFQGSDHVADEEHFKIVQGAGGDMNGTTDLDRTNYFETLPKNYLETALWLEADRMGFLLDAVTQKKFEVQRATVKNEKGQRENRPYGRLNEVKGQILYPPNHPYNWPTIGYVEDLNRVNVEDLKNFFMRWYGPNNASLVVAGDVDPADVLKLAMKYFGSIPRGPEVRKQRVEPVRLPDNVYANFGDNIVLPLIFVTYPTVPNYHVDEPAIDVLALVLGNGNNSIFYKNFVKSDKALQAFVQSPSSELTGEFSIGALAFPYGDVDMEVLIKQTLEEFNKQGVSDDDMARAKALMETQIMSSMESIGGKASQLAKWNYLLPGKSYNLKDEQARYAKVTKEDVMRVFRQYIYGKNAAIVNVWAKQKDPNAKEEDKDKKEETPLVTSSGKASTELEYKGLSYKKPVDNFDRSKKPTIASAVVPVVPKMYRATFDNGLKVIGSTTTEVPMVTMILNIKGGNNVLANDLGKSGLAAMTASMMGESTQNYTSEAFSNMLDKLGSSIQFSASRTEITMWVSAPKKNLDATLKLVEEKLLRPNFTAEDYKLIQKQTAESINAERVNAGDQADKAYARLLFGKTILAEPVNGSIKTIKGMGVKDVQAFYDKYFSPSVSNLVIVGDVTEAEIMPKIAFLKTWAKKDVVFAPVVAKPAAIEKTQIYIVDQYKAVQSEIRVGYQALPYDYNGKFFKSTVMNFPLGGSFNSRLNLNLREDKGFTYGIRAGFNGSKEYGTFTVSAGVKANATDSSIKEIFNELTKYRQSGVTEEELAYTKQSMKESDVLRYETSYDKASFLGQIARYDLPTDYISQQSTILQSINKAEIDALAKEMLPTDKMVIVIVGDKDKIIESLGKLQLNYEPGFKSGTSLKIVDYKVE